MEENTQVAQEPVTSTTETQSQQVATLVEKKPDIMDRVHQLKQDVKPVEDDAKFDYKDIDSIQDPAAKEVAMNAYKSFQRGFNRKFQDLAELRKNLETAGTTQKWTPEAVQGLMQNPEFVQSAQSVMSIYNQTGGTLTAEEYSALTDSEKRQFADMQNQIRLVSQQNNVLLKQQQDENIKKRYANYDANAVDVITDDIIKGTRVATREDVWKVINYENAVKNAYDLGKQDRQLSLKEKVESTTTEGVTIQPTQDVPGKQEGESNVNYFKRLANRRLSESSSGKLRQGVQ